MIYSQAQVAGISVAQVASRYSMNAILDFDLGITLKVASLPKHDPNKAGLRIQIIGADIAGLY